MASKIKNLIDDIKNMKKDKEGDFIPGDMTIDSITDDLADEVTMNSDELDKLADEYEGSEDSHKNVEISKLKPWQIGVIITAILALTVYQVGFPFNKNDVNNSSELSPLQNNEVSRFEQIEPTLPIDSFTEQRNLIAEANNSSSAGPGIKEASTTSADSDDILPNDESGLDVELDVTPNKNVHSDPLLIDKEIGSLRSDVDSIMYDLSKITDFEERLSKLENLSKKKEIPISKVSSKEKAKPKSHNIRLKKIIVSAENCPSCVDHALIIHRGEKIFVGNGDVFSGHKVSIVGDRLDLLTKGVVKHSYWIDR